MCGAAWSGRRVPRGVGCNSSIRPTGGNGGSSRNNCRRRGTESGSAVVDFALVGGLLVVIFIAIVQLALVLHVRNTLIDAASSGARYGALADRTAGDARDRCATLITGALNEHYAQNITVDDVQHLGLRTVRVTVRAPIPVLGLIGPAGILEVSGHAAMSR